MYVCTIVYRHGAYTMSHLRSALLDPSHSLRSSHVWLARRWHSGSKVRFRKFISGRREIDGKTCF